MTTTANYDTEVDGVKLTVRITAEDESNTQDPAMVRGFVYQLSRDVQETINNLGDINHKD